jgi:hypothetical protein
MGKLLFNPDDSVNYLEDAFGLPGFVSPPVRRHSVPKRMEGKFIDRKPIPDKENRKQKRNWAYAIIVPVFLLMGWFIFFGNLKFRNAQQSGILTISDSDLIHNTRTELPIKPKDISSPPLESLDLRDQGGSGMNDSHVSSVKELNTPLVSKKYYIIGGAFGIEMNADKLIAVLRKKGYAAERAGISNSGLHLVSYFSTEDKSEALVNLGNIRKEDNPEAWLMRK